MYSAKNKTDDVAQLFVKSVEHTTQDIYNRFKFSEAIIFTKDDKTEYDAANTCHICDGAEVSSD